MLSSRIKSNDNDDDGGEESILPGDYEPWSRRPDASGPFQSGRRRRPPPPPPPPPLSRSPVRSATPRAKMHRSRRRSHTPEIVIDRRHHHHNHHNHHRHRRSSSKRHIMTIPLNYQPTLGLSDRPTQVLEIERVRRRRHRKHRSLCHKYDDRYYNPSGPVSYYQPMQLPTMTSVGNTSALMTYISNLTPQMIENLPRQTVHLPPIHLPGSQADVNTELNTVVFPAEVINPADGTLSIIRSNSQINNIQYSPMVSPPVPVPTPTPTPSMAVQAMLSGPFMQQVENLFQRIKLSQAQSPSILPTNNISGLPTYSFIDPQNPPIINIANTNSYPHANILPYNPVNIPSNIPTTNTPYQPANRTPYRPASNAPYSPARMTPYQPTNARPHSSYYPTTAPYSPANSSEIGPYRPANITPYSVTQTRSHWDNLMSPTYSPNSFQSQPNYQTNPSMPKPILRNGSPNSSINTTYTQNNVGRPTETIV